MERKKIQNTKHSGNFPCAPLFFPSGYGKYFGSVLHTDTTSSVCGMFSPPLSQLSIKAVAGLSLSAPAIKEEKLFLLGGTHLDIPINTLECTWEDLWDASNTSDCHIFLSYAEGLEYLVMVAAVAGLSTDDGIRFLQLHIELILNTDLFMKAI